MDEYKEPDETVSMVREIDYLDGAEDVKHLQFSGAGKTVQVGIPDTILPELIQHVVDIRRRMEKDKREMAKLIAAQLYKCPICGEDAEGSDIYLEVEDDPYGAGERGPFCSEICRDAFEVEWHDD